MRWKRGIKEYKRWREVNLTFLEMCWKADVFALSNVYDKKRELERETERERERVKVSRSDQKGVNEKI